MHRVHSVSVFVGSAGSPLPPRVGRDLEALVVPRLFCWSSAALLSSALPVRSLAALPGGVEAGVLASGLPGVVAGARSTPRRYTRGIRSRRRRRGSGRRPCPPRPPRPARPCPLGELVHGPRAQELTALSLSRRAPFGLPEQCSAAPPMAAPRGVGFRRGALDRRRGAGRERARWSGTLSGCSAQETLGALPA